MPTMMYYTVPEDAVEEITTERILNAAVTAYMYTKPVGISSDAWMKSFKESSYFREYYIGLALNTLCSDWEFVHKTGNFAPQVVLDESQKE